jgi:hypothetical protein
MPLRPSLLSPNLLSPRLRRSALAAACAALLLGFGPSQSAIALDDGDENIFNTLTNVIGFGPFSIDKPDDKPVIQYRERPPLVLPPNLSQLPPPSAQVGERNQAWPQDFDKTRSQKQAQERIRRSRDDADKPMSVEEMRKGRIAGGQQRNPGAENCDEGGLERLCNPGDFWGKLKSVRATADTSKDLVAGQEPARRNLTEPPAGLRKPTTAVKYTFDARREVDPMDPRAQQREEARRRDAAQRGDNID